MRREGVQTYDLELKKLDKWPWIEIATVEWH